MLKYWGFVFILLVPVVSVNPCPANTCNMYTHTCTYTHCRPTFTGKVCKSSVHLSKKDHSPHPMQCSIEQACIRFTATCNAMQALNVDLRSETAQFYGTIVHINLCAGIHVCRTLHQR